MNLIQNNNSFGEIKNSIRLIIGKKKLNILKEIDIYKEL